MYDRFVLIDAHVHIGPWTLPGLEILAKSLDDAVRAALHEGITGMAVTRSDGGSNDELRLAVAEENRIDLWFLPWIRPGTGEARTELQKPGPRPAALKLHPSLDRTPATHRGYDDAFEGAVEADIPVVIHTGRWQEIAGFEHALERAKKHPALRMIVAHAGGNEFGLRTACCRRIRELGLDNVWLDLTGLGMPIFTKSLVDELGADRFLFGSDYPLGHPRVQIAHITAMGLTQTEEDAIFGGNAQKLFGSPSRCRGEHRE